MTNASCKGKIVAYSEAVNAGTIIGEDGRVYLFLSKDWISKGNPQAKFKVSFIAESTYARSVSKIESI